MTTLRRKTIHTVERLALAGLIAFIVWAAFLAHAAHVAGRLPQ